MKEALRLCAPVPSLPRRTVRDVEYDGFHIPKGSFITMAPYFTHYMEEYWPDAERFDPERFAEHRRESNAATHTQSLDGASDLCQAPSSTRVVRGARAEAGQQPRTHMGDRLGAERGP